METEEVVAVKKVRQDKTFKNRELQLLKEVVHPNIIYLKHYFYTVAAQDVITYYLLKCV